jgi:hypothetical protein
MFTALTKEERGLLKSRINEAKSKSTSRRMKIFPNSAESFAMAKVLIQNRIRERLIQIGAPYKVFIHSFDRRLYKIQVDGVPHFYFPVPKMNEISMANSHMRESLRLKYNCRERSIIFTNSFTSVTMTKGEFWTALTVAEGDEVTMEFLPYLKQDIEDARKKYLELKNFQIKLKGFLEDLKKARRK